MSSANAEMSPAEYLDIACILDAGVVTMTSAEGFARIPKNLDDRHILAFIKLEKPILFWFFVTLLDLLDGQRSEAPDYGRYSEGIEIGTVKQYPARGGDVA